jgi:hypothetical protein
MTELRNYLEAHRNLRVAAVGLGFIAASFALYMVVALSFLVQRADNLLILSFVIVALILDLGIGWTLHLHTRGQLWGTIFLSSAGIVAGMILTSIAMWRGHWLEVVKDIFGSITSMH